MDSEVLEILAVMPKSHVFLQIYPRLGHFQGPEETHFELALFDFTLPEFPFLVFQLVLNVLRKWVFDTRELD